MEHARLHIKNKNVIGICAFKEHAGIWFYQGAILTDPLGVLKNAQEGKTQAMRHWKVKSYEGLDLPNMTTYIHEAIDNEKNGNRIPMIKTSSSYIMSERLQQYLAAQGLASFWEQLTPGRQKEYAEYISIAKRESTIVTKLEKM